MKHLFIMRHGHYNYDSGSLTELGRRQIDSVSRQMKEIAGEHNGVYLLSSTATRALESAEIIAANLGIDRADSNQYGESSTIHTHGGDDLTQHELAHLDSLLEPFESRDVVAVSTHFEVVGSFPMHVMRKFGKDVYIDRPDKGEGVYINMEKGTYQMLFPN